MNVAMLRIFHKHKGLVRGENGVFRAEVMPRHFNKVYADALVRYINVFDPLFAKAQEKNEFEFILTLLRFRGIQLLAADPYENSVLTFNAVMDLLNRVDSTLRINMDCGFTHTSSNPQGRTKP